MGAWSPLSASASFPWHLGNLALSLQPGAEAHGSSYASGSSTAASSYSSLPRVSLGPLLALCPTHGELGHLSPTQIQPGEGNRTRGLTVLVTDLGSRGNSPHLPEGLSTLETSVSDMPSGRRPPPPTPIPAFQKHGASPLLVLSLPPSSQLRLFNHAPFLQAVGPPVAWTQSPHLLSPLGQETANFSIKGKIANTSGSAGLSSL